MGYLVGLQICLFWRFGCVGHLVGLVMWFGDLVLFGWAGLEN